MSNSSKETILWLDDHHVLWPNIVQLSKEFGYKLQICSNTSEFLQATEAYEEKPGNVKAFILQQAVILKKPEDIQAFEAMLPGFNTDETNQSVGGLLLAIHCLRKNAEAAFSDKPILFHTAFQGGTEKALEKIAYPSRFRPQNLALTDGISCIVKNDERHSIYKEQLQAWFSSLEAA